MTEFEELFSDEFFIIDSNNLDSVEQKLYGFILNNGNVIYDDGIEELTGEGTYVFVKNSESEISIHQDFNGSFGVYIYNDGENFAISNSFIHLVEYLKNKYKLSLNEDYSKLLLSCGLCSMIYRETLINEIECIPRNYVVNINRNDKTLSFKKIDYDEHSIDLNSKEALNVLDKWFNKWVNIIRSIKSKSNNIQVDLSGGFDSRVISVLWLNANVDLNKIYIRSSTNKERYGEDYEIATKISKEFNFSLNNQVFSTEMNYFKDINTILNLSFYTKLGFHNQLNYRFGRTSQPVYYISGIAGETIRESRLYGGKTPDELKNYLAGNCKKRDESFEKPVKRIIQRTLDSLSDEFNVSDRNSYDLTNLVYPETKCRNHFGKLTVEEYLSNKIALTPSLDPDLHKLNVTTAECGDNHLLIALIILRYCPKLLEFDIEGGRGFDPETLEYARKINEISPYEHEEYEFVSGPEPNKTCSGNSSRFNWDIVNNYLKDIFYSRKFQMEFMKYFSEKTYYYISNTIENRNYFPMQNACAAFSVLKVIKDVEISNFNKSNIDEWFECFKFNDSSRDINLQASKLLLNYATSRIDIKNFGNAENSIEILDISDKKATIKSPKWFKNDKGVGKVLNSINGELKFKIKCINDGKLKISFKSLDVKDANKNRFPIFIDYTSVKINGEDYLDESFLASHSKPLIYESNVKNDEIIEVKLSWLPFNSKSNYEVDHESENFIEKFQKRFF